MVNMLPALETQPNPCLCCPPIPGVRCLSSWVHPGFGFVRLWREDDPDWQTPDCFEMREDATLQDVEDIAAGSPDHDWRLKINAPLYDVMYQRQGEGRWVLVERGRGFA